MNNNKNKNNDDKNSNNDKLVKTIPIQQYESSSLEFKKLYKHYCLDQSQRRMKMEMQNFFKYFILREYMESNHLNMIFYSSSDSSVLMNITTLYQHTSLTRCDAIVNIPLNSMSRRYWNAGSEASYWSLSALTDFTEFLKDMYTNTTTTTMLSQKARHSMSCISDDNLIYLWFVSRASLLRPKYYALPGGLRVPVVVGSSGKKSSGSSDSGRNGISNEEILNNHRIIFYKASLLELPPPTTSIPYMCNGMDPIRLTTTTTSSSSSSSGGGHPLHSSRIVFDHNQGWSQGSGFHLDYNTNGGVIATLQSQYLYNGGGGDGTSTTTLTTVPRYQNNKKSSGSDGGSDDDNNLQFATLHYRGSSKELITYDICRALLGEQRLEVATRKILDLEVVLVCRNIIMKHSQSNNARPPYRCQQHSTSRGSHVCT